MWVREYLQQTARKSPRRRFDVPEAIGNYGWDAFAAECGVLLLAEDPRDQLARELVAIGVTSFHYGTTAITMRRGFALRGRLGDEFLRMQALAARWAAVRHLRVRAEKLQIGLEQSIERHMRLVVDFIEGALAAEVSRLSEVNEAALADINELDTRRFPDRTLLEASGDRPEPSWWHRQEVRRLPSGLDLRVVECAFSWLNPQSSEVTAFEPRWRERVREFLGLALVRMPVIETPARQKVDGHPGDYDRWTFGLACRAILNTDSAEDRRSFWQPVLDLGSPAHSWVEHFFWEWFTVGFEVAKTPEQFCRAWSEMVEYALGQPSWDPETARTYDLDDMVFELLGFHWGARTIGEDARYRECLGGLASLFERAGRRWLSMEKVTAGYARFLARPATARLLCTGICGLYEALRESDAREWSERDLDESLIQALHACWERQGEAVVADLELREAFLGLLTMLASRGSHAALALQEQVLRP